MKYNFQYLSNRRYYAKEILGILFILFAIYFFRHEGHEFRNLAGVFRSSNKLFLFLGAIVTLVYCFSHAQMYVYSFKSIGEHIDWSDGLKLFLKRNFMSVFLPGGGVTSLAFFSGAIEKKGVSRTKVSLASYIFGLIGIFTVFLITIPVIIYLLFTQKNLGGDVIAFTVLCFTITALISLTLSVLNKGWLYHKIVAYKPETALIMEDIAASTFSRSYILKTILISTGIEFLGIGHLLLALYALGLTGYWSAAIVGYVIATLFLVISPFLKGLGAVELSLILILKRYGLSLIEATAVTFLYRIYEFWLPLVFGILSFILNQRNILLRVLPPLLLFLLGIVEIASVLTPALADRLSFLSRFLPLDLLRFSNSLVLFVGLLQLFSAVFLFRGMRTAWNIAVALCIFAAVGNLVKGLDYEESIFALAVLTCLYYTRTQYNIRANKHLQYFSFTVAMVVFLAVTVFGIVGFYYLDQKHFGIDFTIRQSIESTFDNFILLNSGGLEPRTHFASLFLYLIRILGISSILLLFYGSIKPFLFQDEADEEEKRRAVILVNNYGATSIDHFKTSSEKLFFFAEKLEGFIAYRIAGDFAIALEGPVCPNIRSVKFEILMCFEKFCFQQGLKTAYYRVNQENINLFDQMGKKNIVIGQEAIVHLSQFKLEGGAMKSLRNAVTSIQKKGYLIKENLPPQNPVFLQTLKQISAEWLSILKREEMVFSQGQFNEQELKDQVILSLEDPAGKTVAFLNIIPDYAEGEVTYDLIRKTGDAPGGNMDFLIVELLNYAKKEGYQSVNLGMAPMSGIKEARDLPERTIKFAYEKMRMFNHYHGLRAFKQKFVPVWEDKFLVYDSHFDLLRLPGALNEVMKP